MADLVPLAARLISGISVRAVLRREGSAASALSPRTWEKIAVSKNSSALLPQLRLQVFFLYTFPPSFDALSGSLGLWWICPWAISSLRHSHPPPFLSLWLCLPLHPPHPPPAIPSLSVETVKPICFGDTFTGCPGWTVTPWPRGLPKSVTWRTAANK